MTEQRHIVDAFERLDENGDGTITRDELTKVMTRLFGESGRSIGQERIEALMSAVDVNGDGEIDYKEFAAWVIDPGDGREVLERMRASKDVLPVGHPVFVAGLSLSGPASLAGPDRFYTKAAYAS